ncbi:hypothetical protein O181_099891 [Austropuccinia psidii MF-1]|uniref:Uncharacterized protein n=1 Tax=Austropuccinia psidii MF-1 TaxID=1389203 RepID=A0A9Q3JEB6_9BASI|nr:hypothetical protein [Austropuccinia psidii MF-1]
MKEFQESPAPAIKQTNLANAVLLLKALGIEDLFRFECLKPPPGDAQIWVLDLLDALGALSGQVSKTISNSYQQIKSDENADIKSDHESVIHDTCDDDLILVDSDLINNAQETNAVLMI